MYAIMNRELTAYSHGPTLEYNVRKIYEEEKHQRWCTSPKSYLYGSVLVKMKRIKSGFSIKVEINWNHWDRKWGWCCCPTTRGWKYNHCFRWLLLWIWFNWEHEWEVDKVVKDHLGEMNGVTESKP